MGLQKKGDNKTITVSAKITQLGKHILMTDPAAFQITKFALADDEIDYRLWNTNHDNGSTYYGEALDELPLLEPVTDANVQLKYKLITGYNEDNYRMPYFDISPTTITFDDAHDPTTVNIQLFNYNEAMLHAEILDSSYAYILADGASENRTSGKSGRYSGAKTSDWVPVQSTDFPNGGSIRIAADDQETGVEQLVTCRIYGADTNVHSDIQLIIPDNSTIQK